MRIWLKLGKVVAFCLLWPLAALSQHYQSHQLSGQQLVINTDQGQLALTFYQDAVLEVWHQPVGRAQQPSLIIGTAPEPVELWLDEQPGVLTFGSHSLKVQIEKSPLQLSFYYQDKLISRESAAAVANAEAFSLDFALTPDEKLFGAGQRVLGMDRRGHSLPLYNKAHYGYGTHSTQMYFSLAGVMSSQNYMLLFDNGASGQLDLGHSEANTLTFAAQGGRSSYLIVAADNSPQLIERYVSVSGKPPLPARWTLGNYASRFGYRTEAEARAVVKKFRDKQLPLDAIVIDLYWFGPDIQGHMGNLAWDKQAFPEPEKMLADFAADGVHTILVTEPFVLTTSTRWQEAVAAGAMALGPDGTPKTFDFYFGNTGLIDVFKPEAADWFWQIYRGLLQQGVAGIWGDLGEPEVHPADTLHQLPGLGALAADQVHNAYGHRWAELVHQGYLQDFPEQRPFIMMRAGSLGSQRFGMVPWTGDVDRSWDGLKPQVELALQMGLFGFGWIHSDLGGFAGGEVFDAELYTRWMQYGVFQPVYRPHGQEHIAPEPVFHGDEVINRLRPWLELRYRLLPYNYTLAWQHSQSGMPLMRPLYFADESQLALRDETNSYLWGEAFLVAPVTEPGVSSWPVTLPGGVWFDFFSGKRYDQAGQVQVPVTLDTIPVLVKAGSFIPMVAPIARTADYQSAQLELHYYHDSSVSKATAQLYEDDGRTPDAFAKGQYQLLQFDVKASQQQLAFSFSRSGGEYQGKPDSRALTLLVHHQPRSPKAVTVNGRYIRIERRLSRFNRQQNVAYYDAGRGLVKVKVGWQAEQLQLTLH